MCVHVMGGLLLLHGGPIGVQWGAIIVLGALSAAPNPSQQDTIKITTVYPVAPIHKKRFH